MNYAHQQRFLRGSRIWGALAGILLLGAGVVCLQFTQALTKRGIIAFGLTLSALAISLYYTPDYLHLTPNWIKRPQWEIKIRWRVLGAALIGGLLLASTRRGMSIVALSIVWLTCANLFARWLPKRYFTGYFWATDFALLAALSLTRECDLLLATALLAASAHLCLVIAEERLFLWASLAAALSALLILLSSAKHGDPLMFVAAAVGLLAVSTFGTAGLVHRAETHNQSNIDAAMRELMEFTGYSREQIRHLWSTSDQQLAKNWQLAAIAHDDGERLAAWYCENSEHYLFAISAYNLHYKRIRSNLYVLQFARGACLDYGAGNGELVLELARRGHEVMYYDVEGTTMRFARQRALQQSLTIQFAQSKEELAAMARHRGLDTVFAFDVLEHLPDLPGELDFLSSLLRPGGQLIFDVPAGSTKSHPMHLNHNLDVRAYLRAKGLEEKRTWMQRLPFKKEEKYLFRAPEEPVQNAPSLAGSS